MKSIIATALVASLTTGSTGCVMKRYDVTVRFKPDAADRRLAKGQSDVIKGKLERNDGTSLYINSGGSSEPVTLADIGEVEQDRAKRDVRWGTGFAIGGTALAVVSAFYFDCGQNEFPVACAFKSEGNFWAGLSFVGGIALAVGGVGAIISGKADQSRNADLLRGVVRF